ncbi:TPA: (deoxy)nucleoside triphosphate pyrophosphohydrolase [Mannheimia haemolytica]
MAHRPAKENFPVGWEFPGGKIESGESPESCLVRELNEELGIKTKVNLFCTEIVHHYPTISIKLKAYYCSIASGEIQMLIHDNLKWVEIWELLSYELLPADIPIAINSHLHRRWLCFTPLERGY